MRETDLVNRDRKSEDLGRVLGLHSLQRVPQQYCQRLQLK